MRPIALVGVMLLAVMSAAAAEPAKSEAVPAGAAEILNLESYWRWFLTLRKPVISVEALKAAGQPADAPKLLVGTVVPPPYNQVDHQESPVPPAGWDALTFDDYGWPRSRLSWLRGNAFGRFSSAILCLRGKFQVSDPAAVQGLYLTIKYYGGVRVLLNGREVARGHLPAGELAPEVSAELYPDDVNLDAKGQVVMGDYCTPVPMRTDKDRLERIARRTRVLGPVKLPADAVRKGENLLTVEVRRSEYPFLAVRWFKPPEGATKPFWVPMNLLELRLEAAGAGVVPNVARPRGLQVWSENVNDRITPFDYGDAGEGLRPVRIAGARNGSFGGQFVVGSDQPLKGVKAAAGDLKAAKGGSTGSPPEALSSSKGPGVIPAANVTLLYALPDIAYYGMPTWFDALQSEPPAEVPVGKGGGAVQPVLLRVKVPKDAPAGDYRGEVAVSVAGAAPVKVPVELSVAAWTVPDPKDYRTYVGVYQSPTSLALQYKVPEWSEEHWKLMEKSFALLGRAGNRLVNVTVVDKTQFGNDDGMIYWVKKPDGSFGYDFKVFDRYMDLAQKYFTLDYVALHIWHSGGWETRKADQENTVTVLDEKTGERSHLQVPKFDSEEAKAFWKPLLEAVHARLAKRNLEKTMILGILSDGTAPKEVFAMFNAITPGGARWMRGCHAGTYSVKPDALPGGGVTVLHEFCYGTPLDKAKPLAPYHQQRWWPGTDYERISGHEQVVSLGWYRDTGMTALMRRTRGIGRVCLDFWPVLKGGNHSVDLYNRFPQSSCAQREPSLKKMIWAGPDGPATALRYEAFVEGIQYAEALVAVSEALETKTAALGTEKVEAYRKLLTEMWCREVRVGGGSPLRPNHEGWQDQIRQLFDAAAESAKVTGGRTGG